MSTEQDPTQEIIRKTLTHPARKKITRQNLDLQLDLAGPDQSGLKVEQDKKIIRAGETYLLVLLNDQGVRIAQNPMEEDEALALYIRATVNLSRPRDGGL